jgi:copper(I)-binding protein
VIRRFVCVAVFFSYAISGVLFAEPLKIIDPYVRALPPGVPNSAAFLVIENPTARSTTLIGAQTEIAARAELHNHLSEDGVMKMRQVKEIEIPAKGSVTLAPGGLHIMLFELTSTPKPGDTVPITLIFADDSRIDVKAQVRDLRKSAEQHHHHHHHD